MNEKCGDNKLIKTHEIDLFCRLDDTENQKDDEKRIQEKKTGITRERRKNNNDNFTIRLFIVNREHGTEVSKIYGKQIEKTLRVIAATQPHHRTRFDLSHHVLVNDCFVTCGVAIGNLHRCLEVAQKG